MPNENKMNLIRFLLLLETFILMQLCRGQLLPAEQTAMDQLKASITPNPWNTGETNPCAVTGWTGVTCSDAKDHVIGLNLNFGNAYTIDLPSSIGDLSNLQTLAFNAATFTSEIPATLSQTQLKALTIDYSTNATFPTTGVFSNFANGSITSFYSTFTNLPSADVFPLTRTMIFFRCLVDATIPSNYGNLDFLTDLRIQSSKESPTFLHGTIPSELGNLPRLTTLALENNKLTGSIPPELANIKSLVTLSLAGNLLNGTIPAQLGIGQPIETLSLDNNQLTGPIPSSLFQPKLSVLSVGNNRLTDPYPDTSNATSVFSIVLDNNAFPPGPIPSNFYQIPSMAIFSCANNQFTGSIPVFAGTLIDLNLANNSLTGDIPSSLNLAGCINLDLSGNKLTGVIPDNLLKAQSLSSINLSYNSLAGCVPNTTYSFLNFCSFQGNVLCCPNGTLACDDATTECLVCNGVSPAEGAICMYNEKLEPVWLVTGDIVVTNNTEPIENTVINGNVVVVVNVTLSNVVINGNLSVNNAQLTVNNGIIDVRGCAFVNGTLVLNLTPEEAQQLAANGTLERVLLAYDAECTDSSVNFDQIVINGTDDCSEASGKQQNAPGLVSILLSAKDLCQVEQPINTTGPSPQLPDWAIAVIVVGCILVCGAIITGVLVSRQKELQQKDKNLQKKLKTRSASQQELAALQNT